MTVKYNTSTASRRALVQLIAVALITSMIGVNGSLAQQETKFTATDPVELATFGVPCEIIEGRIAISAPTVGNGIGKVYMFEKQDDGRWLETAILQATDGAIGHSFGSTIALSGKRLFIGASGRNIPDDNMGGVYIFERLANGTWVERTILIGSDTVPGDRFGGGLAVHRDRLFMRGANKVYVFEQQTDGSWAETHIFIPEEGFQYTRLAASKNRVMIAVRDSNHKPVRATIYEKRRDGSWIARADLLPDSNTPDSNDFLSSLALWGDYALIGGSDDDRDGLYAGTAYLFERESSGEWVKKANLTPHDPSDWHRFGQKVDLWGNRAVVTSETDYNYAGAVYVFERQADGNWIETHKLSASEKNDWDLLGSSVSTYGSYVLAGAPLREEQGITYAGAAFLFDLTPGVTSFSLIDADTEEPITAFDPFRDGAELDLSNLPPNLNVRANVMGNFESVLFGFDGNDAFHIEVVEPYALFGDIEGDYLPGSFVSGDHVLKATPYTLNNASGEAGLLLEITFKVLNGTAPLESNASKDAQFERTEQVELHSAFPNPFNPTATIRFSIPEADYMRLIVYDLLGREVMRLVDGIVEPGNHEVTFDAGALPSGTYLYRLETPKGSFIRKMLLLK